MRPADGDHSVYLLRRLLVQHHNQSRAARAETLASKVRSAAAQRHRNRKTKPIIAAGVAAGLATIGVMGN